VEVAAAAAPRQVSGFAVDAMAFASPTAGWALVGVPGVCRLLYTDDGGATWRTQLAWDGSVGGLTALDAGRAGLLLGLWPRDDRVNGHPVGIRDVALLLATTGDVGATWTLGWPPRPKEVGGGNDFLNPPQSWLLTAPTGRYPQCQVARTEEGRRVPGDDRRPDAVPNHRGRVHLPGGRPARRRPRVARRPPVRDRRRRRHLAPRHAAPAAGPTAQRRDLFDSPGPAGLSGAARAAHRAAPPEVAPAPLGG
jgi:hypothetical protein